MSHRIRPVKGIHYDVKPTKVLRSFAEPKERINRYTCTTCLKSIVTVDRDKGVTPFMIACRATAGCEGSMQSSFYRDGTGTPSHEWRKPNAAEYATMSQAMREHIDAGGLQIYRIQKDN